MAEFVNLNDANETPEIIPYSPTSLELITPNSEILNGDIARLYVQEYLTDPEATNLETLTLSVGINQELEETDENCETCNPADFYGDTYVNKTFNRDNLFSELTSDYERAIARKNLGIAEEFSLTWGNISGNFRHQEDLYNFIVDSTAININELIGEINLKLTQWGYDIKISLDSKAPIESPSFSGVPTAPTPTYNDSSNQIPTTEWVTNKFIEIGSIVPDLKFIQLNKNSINIGEPAIELIVSWDYNAEIQAQSINGIPLLLSRRTHIFPSVSTNKTIVLSYTINGVTYQKEISFTVITPIYYGTSVNYNTGSKIDGREFILNCGDSSYGYIFVPGVSPVRISIDGFVGGFINLGTVLIYNVTYTIYKTANFGLGKLYITIL